MLVKLYRKVEHEGGWLKLKLKTGTLTESTIDTIINAILDEITALDSSLMESFVKSKSSRSESVGS